MDSAIKTFDFKSDAGELLASVRTALIDNTPWFIAADVSKALGYSQTQAMTKLIDAEDKSSTVIQIGCNYTNQSIINESGLYTAIMSSHKPEAKRFQRWITTEVLPSIRSTGSYGLAPASNLPDFSDEIAAAEAWVEAKKAERLAIGYVRRQAQYIEHLENLFQPGMTPFQFCKQLNGVNISQINAFLEKNEWLYDERPDSRSSSWRVKSYARDLYLREKHNRVDPCDTESFDTWKPILLRKGAVWLYRHYLKGNLPMKKNWDGKYSHDTDLAGAA